MSIRVIVICFCLLAASLAQTNSSSPTTTKSTTSTPVTQHAKGTFEVKLTQQKADEGVGQAANVSRYSGEKQFHGDLEATSRVEMIGAQTETKGSAGYVAMEPVTGK